MHFESKVIKKASAVLESAARAVYVSTVRGTSRLSRPATRNAQSIALKRIAARRIDANVVSFLSRKLLNRVQPKFKDFCCVEIQYGYTMLHFKVIDSSP